MNARSLASSLDGQVALIARGDEGIGRAIALLLSSRGARVVVVGAKARALGEVVGEIANAGGKARHVAGELGDPKVRDAAVAKAIDVFGELHVVVGCEDEASLTALFRAAATRMNGPGRLIAVSDDAAASSRMGALGLELALGSRRIGCDAVDPGIGAEPDDVAARIASLCANADEVGV